MVQDILNISLTCSTVVETGCKSNIEILLVGRVPAGSIPSSWFTILMLLPIMTTKMGGDSIEVTPRQTKRRRYKPSAAAVKATRISAMPLSSVTPPP
jgi:hypothetical protein